MSIKKLGSTKLTDDVLVSSVNLASEVTGILGVANGGTGQSVFTNGQLLIGNTTGNTLTKATLTEGSGISVTNGTGTITLATTAAQAHVTSLGTLTSLTVSGNLTVDTNTLFVDAANNRVGVGTASPASTFHVRTGTDENLRIFSDSGVRMQALNDASSATNTLKIAGSPLVFLGTGGSETARIDSSGNLGLGVTPSAWSGIKAFEFGTGTANGSLYSFGNDTTLSANVYYNGGFKYVSTSTATRYQQSNGQHIWYNAASGTAGNAITFTQAMTLNASGNLGIGTTSPADRLHVIGNLSLGSSSNAQIIYRTASNWRYHLGAVNDDFFIYDAQNVNYFAAYYNGGGTGKYASILGALNVINSGNVGIGTTSPTTGYKLDVRGNVIIPTGNFYAAVNTANGNNWGLLRGDNSGNTIIGDAQTIYVTAGGNVGIGTSSPGGRLHVSAVSTNNVLRLERTGTSAGGGFIYANVNEMFGVTDGTLYPFLVKQGAPTESLVVASSGNVGIGTTSPDYRLTIITPTSDATIGFNLRAYTTGADGDRTTISRYTSSNNTNWAWHEAHAWAHIWKCNGVEQMRLTSGGNVGIGTTSPNASLDVQGNYITVHNNTTSINTICANLSLANKGTVSSTGSDAGARIVAITGSGNWFDSTQMAFYTHPGPDVTATASVERMRITGAGNVGIGTTSPASLLHLNGTDPILRLQDSAGGDVFGVYVSDTLGLGVFNFTDSRQDLTISGAGNVGIGTTSPSNFSGLSFGGPILDVTGSINIRGTAGNGVSALQMGGDTYRKAVIYTPVGTDTPYLAFGVATGGSASTASEFVRITSSGNVGIGTTNPLNGRLQVNKTVRIDDDLGGAGSNTLTGSSNLYIGSTTGGGTLQYNASRGLDLWLFNTAGNWTRYFTFTRDGNFGIGTTSPTQPLHVNGNATAADFILTSDRRLKRDLVEITGALATVLSWAGYTYRPVDGERRRAGLMAQDVEPTAPELVYTSEDGYKSLSYEQAVPYLVEAIRDLYRLIEARA